MATNNWNDNDWKRRFRDLREEEARKAPPFDPMWERAGRHCLKRVRRIRMYRLAASVVLAVVIFFAGWHFRTSRTSPVADWPEMKWQTPTDQWLKTYQTASLSSETIDQWKSPTQFLLIIPEKAVEQ